MKDFQTVSNPKERIRILFNKIRIPQLMLETESQLKKKIQISPKRFESLNEEVETRPKDPNSFLKRTRLPMKDL